MSEPDITLPTALTAQLGELARAFKAAARVVVLYPGGHPSVGTTLNRLVQLTSSPHMSATLRLGVTRDSLVLDGRSPARPDSAIAELAALLHRHAIGELVIRPEGDVEAWRCFLSLIGRPPEDVRAEGGIAQVWAETARGHVEIREIDYAELLRERKGTETATWEQVITRCLVGDASGLTRDACEVLLEAAGHPDRLRALIEALDARGSRDGGGLSARTAALIQLLREIVEVVDASAPERTDTVLDTMGAAIGGLSPELMHALVATSRHGDDRAATLVTEIAGRVPDKEVAGFVARNAGAEGAALERLAQAFQTLVVDDGRRERLLELAHDVAAESPFGAEPDFDDKWDQLTEKLLTTYSDKAYVSDDYARELSGARTEAIQVEQVSDDPPERVAEWIATVDTARLRVLDLTLVCDLMRIEENDDRWVTMVRPVAALTEDLLLVGDMEGAETLVTTLTQDAKTRSSPARQEAMENALRTLVAGPLMRHLGAHLGTVGDEPFDRIRAICLAIGDPVIAPLAEALAAEERPRHRDRLTALLLAFGARGGREADRLRHSANPAVRRTAVYLLREFGGREALADLAAMLDDTEAGVQRDAVRAIARIGTERACQIIERAISSGTAQSREAVLQALGTLREEGAAPLFAYLLRRIDHRGPLRDFYTRAIETLGRLGDPGSVPALQDVLRRGEWWAPRRTAALRTAAAAALARLGTPEAAAALDEAARTGSRGVRAAVRAHCPAAHAAGSGATA
jgi:hypothetical protein